MAGFSLPNEIWCKIFTYLPLEPKKNATATCKLWSSLIRQDPKLSGHILISWHNMETALETLHWNWSNWPVLKTLELTKLELVKETRESMQNVIEKLSLKDNCPASLKEVLFKVDLADCSLLEDKTIQLKLLIKLYKKLRDLQKTCSCKLKLIHKNKTRKKEGNSQATVLNF